jgi:hypothetical protein
MRHVTTPPKGWVRSERRSPGHPGSHDDALDPARDRVRPTRPGSSIGFVAPGIQQPGPIGDQGSPRGGPSVQSDPRPSPGRGRSSGTQPIGRERASGGMGGRRARGRRGAGRLGDRPQVGPVDQGRREAAAWARRALRLPGAVRSWKRAPSETAIAGLEGDRDGSACERLGPGIGIGAGSGAAGAGSGVEAGAEGVGRDRAADRSGRGPGGAEEEGREAPAAWRRRSSIRLRSIWRRASAA